MNVNRKSNVDTVKIERIIHVTSILGKGVEGDPVRVIHEYYTMDGALIARIDSVEIERFRKGLTDEKASP